MDQGSATATNPRRSVDLSAYPDLVVIYLGMQVRTLRGLWTLLRMGGPLGEVRRNPPDGLLGHEGMLFSPIHFGFRQYWRDLESLERFTKTDPHKTWWGKFLRDNGGTGLWHETYRRQGGMEAIYLGMPPIGFAKFAPDRTPQGPFMTAWGRLAA
jgi:hypothetical protein